LRRSIADAADDIAELANALNLQTFCVMGVSGGGPYALACQARLPERVQLTTVVSGLGPVGHPPALRQMGALAWSALQLSCAWPGLMRWFFASRARAFRRDPEGFLLSLVRRWSRSDQELFERTKVREMLLADLREVLIHGQGAEGLVQEMQLYFRWGFELSDIPRDSKVVLWHGQDDQLVPPFMADYVAQHLPGAEVEYRPGGHFMVIDYADEVMRRALEVLERGKRPAPVSTPPGVSWPLTEVRGEP
jgi:pimeloyl-ACP methyl ester carboxylesterase